MSMLEINTSSKKGKLAQVSLDIVGAAIYSFSICAAWVLFGVAELDMYGSTISFKSLTVGHAFGYLIWLSVITGIVAVWYSVVRPAPSRVLRWMKLSPWI